MTRRLEQGVLIDGRIRVRVLSISDGRVQLGIDAPREVEILRDELVAGADRAASPRSKET